MEKTTNRVFRTNRSLGQTGFVSSTPKVHQDPRDKGKLRLVNEEGLFDCEAPASRPYRSETAWQVSMGMSRQQSRLPIHGKNPNGKARVWARNEHHRRDHKMLQDHETQARTFACHKLWRPALLGHSASGVSQHNRTKSVISLTTRNRSLIVSGRHLQNEGRKMI